ncbi:MAG TPA: copper resistance protein CopC [Ktedonobacteraceae bacterium]|nr:copper resistance protein CopC [Ktedonobacteraceae bacterium]
MRFILHWVMGRRFLGFAVPLAICLTLLFPAIASAHAILLRSDPAKDSVLSIAPKQVRMWYSEALNPAFSTAVVVNGENKRVDNRDAHVSSSDQTEMDVTLQPNLPPSVYIVIWRTDSAADGHILRGSFIFSVARADGSVPTLAPGSNPGANVLGSGNLTGLYTGQIDGPTLFNLIMITLVELGAIFWMGAQLWINFVLTISAEAHTEERNTNERVQRRFERYFSLPTLIVLFLANIGVLVGQALNLSGGDLASAISPTLLVGLATSGRFGIYWMMREVVILLAMILALYMLLQQQRSRIARTVLPIANLVLASALLIAITMSGHAAAVNPNIVSYAIVLDWLHLLAASLWVGGMIYIATNYLPVLRRLQIPQQARSLVTVLPYFSPLAIAGVLIMAVTGPFNAAFHLTSWQQFLSTAYGRALLVKITLVGGLLVTSAIHVGILRPRLKKEYQKYSYAANRLQAVQAGTEIAEQNRPIAFNGQQAVTKTAEPSRATKLLTQQVRLREGRLTKKTQLLSRVLRWEPVLGVGVLICVGLMNVFAGTLSPIAVAQQQQQTGSKPQLYSASVHTKDGKFTVTLSVNPNRFGTNVFTVSAVDTSTGAPATNIGISLYTTMLDMDMGTDTVNLLPDGKGHFSGSGDLSMPGNWQIRIQIRTPDATLHEASVKLVTPF